MDENRAAEFTGRVLADSAAAATIVLAALGDRTGLFKDMAEHGTATSEGTGRPAGLAAGSGPAGPGSPSGTCGSGSAACSPPGTWITTTPSSGTPCPPSTCR